MRLKKTWFSYGVWILYLLFNVSLLALSAYISGLFPTQNKIIFTGAFTILVSGGIAVLTFLCWHLFDYFYKNNFSKSRLFKILDIIAFIGMFSVGIIYRLYLVNGYTGELQGNIYLYENSVISAGADSISTANILTFIYESILRFVLSFTGNVPAVAVYYQIVLQVIAVMFIYFAVRIFNGLAGAFVFALYMGILPLYADKMWALSNAYILYVLFGVELYLATLFLKGACLNKYKGALSTAWMILAGVYIGFMMYVDAGSLVTLVLVFSVLACINKTFKRKCYEIGMVLVGLVIGFLIMLIQYDGISHVVMAFDVWFKTYLYNLDTISLYTVYSQYKTYYLGTFILMITAAAGFWKWRKYQCTTPWLLMSILVTVLIPFFGPTLLNSEEVQTLFYAIDIGCGISCIFFDPIAKEGVRTGEEAEEEITEELIEDTVTKDAEQGAENNKEENKKEENKLENKIEDKVEDNISTASKTDEERVIKPELTQEEKEEKQSRQVVIMESSHKDNKVSDDINNENEIEDSHTDTVEEEKQLENSDYDKYDEYDDSPEITENETVNNTPVNLYDSDSESATDDNKSLEEKIIIQVTGDEQKNTKKIVGVIEDIIGQAEDNGLEDATTNDVTLDEGVAETMVIENKPEESEVIKVNLEKEREKRKKYIPEGMILPIGDEDLIDDCKPKFKMPDIEEIGPIEVERHKEEHEEIAVVSKRDDFDIDIQPGDDFDI